MCYNNVHTDVFHIFTFPAFQLFIPNKYKEFTYSLPLTYMYVHYINYLVVYNVQSPVTYTYI